MRRMTALLLAGLAALTLTGCRRGPGLLPYAREIEDMELMQTLGVDRAGEGQVEVTASSGSGDPAEGAATVVSGQAGTISAAVLGMQGEGSSYLYFGHVGQLLLGEGLARQGVEPALDYILRDVETRLDTALYLVRGGTAVSYTHLSQFNLLQYRRKRQFCQVLFKIFWLGAVGVPWR